MKHYLRFLITMLLLAIWGGISYGQETVTDVLTWEKLGISNSGYSSVSNKKLVSNAIYNGWLAKFTTNSDYGIQFASGKKGTPRTNCALYTSETGGTIKSVVVEFCSKTTDERDLNVYAKNVAYNSVDDLYSTDESKLGVLIGTATKTATKTSYTFDGKGYKYIGFVSNAVVGVKKITIVWEKDNRKETTITFPKYSLSFATTNDLSAFTGQKATLKSDGAELTGKTVTYSKSGDKIFSTFDDNTGVLALNGKAGVATVTAKFAGDDVYASSTKSYTVTVKKVYTDIASLKKDITSKSKLNPDKFTADLKDAIVTYKSGDYLYIQDATGGLYSSASNTGLNGNDKINGWVDISVYKDQGQTRVNNLTFYTDTKIAHDAEFTPEIVTLAQLNDNIAAYENMRVRVVGVTLKSVFREKYAEISQDGTTIKLYDKSKNTSWDEKVGDVLDIEGYPCTYNGTKELCVWRKMDVDSPVVLDEISDNISDVIKANADKVVTVTLKRSISKDYLNPVCLPFDLSEDKIAEVFGAGSVVSDYTSVEGTVMNFTPVTTMTANHPYIVQATESFDTKNIAGVTLKTYENKENSVTFENSNHTFLGSFVGSPSIVVFSKENIATNLFLGKDGNLYHPTADSKMKGMRAYFDVYDYTGSEAKVNIGGGLSSIGKLMNGEAITGKVYNLNGQYVGNTLDGLAKGLYIINGKKYIVK